MEEGRLSLDESLAWRGLMEERKELSEVKGGMAGGRRLVGRREPMEERKGLAGGRDLEGRSELREGRRDLEGRSELREERRASG